MCAFFPKEKKTERKRRRRYYNITNYTLLAMLRYATLCYDSSGSGSSVVSKSIRGVLFVPPMHVGI